MFEVPEFTVKFGDRHTHGFLGSAELAESFTRILVSFPENPPVGFVQHYLLRDSTGHVSEGVPDEDQGNAKWSVRSWVFDRLTDGATSFSLEMALSPDDAAPADDDYALIGAMVL
jgi:hypothetical protein